MADRRNRQQRNRRQDARGQQPPAPAMCEGQPKGYGCHCQIAASREAEHHADQTQQDRARRQPSLSSACGVKGDGATERDQRAEEKRDRVGSVVNDDRGRVDYVVGMLPQRFDDNC